MSNSLEINGTYSTFFKSTCLELLKKGRIMENKKNNPLSELISDDIYEILDSRGLINKKSVRDYMIRKRFDSLRKNDISAGDAIENIQKDYPYLQFDSIRKIIYNRSSV